MKEKIPSTIDEQIDKLKSRGCTFEDEDFARRTLQHINYFRIVNYFEPFRADKHNYLPGTSFEKIMRIYEFDRKLRSIIISALEETEISLRAIISNYHSLKYGALGYLNPNTFDYKHNHNTFMSKIRHLIDVNEDREFVKHYNTKYRGAFPLWVIMELFSFGTLAFFYKDMQSADKKELAEDFFGCSASDLDNWIFCMNDLRNYCAHYNRLYANTFPIQPRTPRDFEPQLEANPFGYMIVLKQLYHDHTNWNERVVKPVARAIKKNSDVIRMSDIGFPENWEELMRFSE
ncbi:MAG: Abi family protein [Oscillospiraceae bacterium]